MKNFLSFLNDEKAVKKVLLFIAPFLLIILIVAGVGIGIHVSNQYEPSEIEETNQTDEGEKAEPLELTVDFFGEFEPFECKGDYTFFSYEGDVRDRNGICFYTKSSKVSGEHKNMLMYVLPNLEEGMVFMLGDTDADVEVMSVIDDALYFNVYHSKGAELDGFYRMLLKYNEAGEVSNGGITMRLNLNFDPKSAGDNTILLSSGKELYLFDTLTGEYEHVPYLPTSFEPFECSGDYYSFEDLKNQYGFAFEKQYFRDNFSSFGGTYKIVYIHNNEEKVLFDSKYTGVVNSVSVLAYIDDNLFFSVRQNRIGTLYRMAFEYDGDGNIINSDIYFVAENVYWPVKVLDNALIILTEYEEYVSFNTKTGEMSPVEYNKEVDAGSVKVSVSSNKAIEIAEKELEKDMYRVGGHEEKYIPNIDGIAPVLIHYPDLIYHGDDSLRVEDYPEYVWLVRYDTESLYQQVMIYVNAMSGEISYVQILRYP